MPQAGEIWLAAIPFTTGAATKLRPVLILWQDGNDFVVSAVTSAAPRSRTDVSLSDWSVAGLRVASVVRLSRLDCLESILMRRKLGTISRADGQALKVVWTNEIHLQF